MTLTKKIGIPVVVAAMALMALVALQPAEAGGMNEYVSGNFIDTAIDTNEDGMQANYFSGAVKGRNGATYEGLVEVAFSEETTGLCEPNVIEGTVVAYSIVRRYDTGDLLYSSLVDGLLCFDPVSGLADLDINAELTGGTGRFANATGTYAADFTVELLVPDPMGGIGHGAFYGRVSG